MAQDRPHAPELLRASNTLDVFIDAQKVRKAGVTMLAVGAAPEVEALVADSRTGTTHWEGFDPTHNRRADAQYLAVAVGRDYADISPVTGSFYGPDPGRLTAWSATVLRGATA